MSRLAWLPLVLLVAAPAAAQQETAQQGTAMQPAMPAAIDAAPPAAPPMAVRRHDGERPSTPPPPSPAPPPRTGPDGTTVQVGDEAPPPENDTPRFRFRDVTDRTSPPVKSLPERAAAVESLRQSLGKDAAR